MDKYSGNYINAMNNDFENCWNCGQFDDEENVLDNEEFLKENMIADSIEQQHEYMEMKAMYEDNQLEA